MKRVLLLAVLFAGADFVTLSSTSRVSAQQNGIAKYYSPGVMEGVAVYRGLNKPSGVSGFAAVPNCGNLGKVATASINGRPAEKYLIVDCSAPQDRARHIRQGLVIEVDYKSAVRNRFHQLGVAPAVVLSILGN